MKELEFIEIIRNTLSKNSSIGDDCAYLKDLDIVVTQDSLVEDIHFTREFSSPYSIGYKAVIVNLSDIFAAGAIPKYLTISLSLPKNTENDFIKEFYNAVEDLSKKYDFEVVGGDITGSNKIFVSACAIGITKGRKISSRSNAKVGDYFIVTGNHGSSAAGLFLLKGNGKREKGKDYFINTHLMPEICSDFSNEIAAKINRNYAMMDTSDGLADALFKIAQASNVTLAIDFDKIPYDKQIKKIANSAKIDYKDWILFGGEDYQLVACLDKENLNKIDKNLYKIIGKVIKKDNSNFVHINFGKNVQKLNDLEKSFNHFED